MGISAEKNPGDLERAERRLHYSAIDYRLHDGDPVQPQLFPYAVSMVFDVSDRAAEQIGDLPTGVAYVNKPCDIDLCDREERAMGGESSNKFFI